jgi:hypothetical protein
LGASSRAVLVTGGASYTTTTRRAHTAPVPRRRFDNLIAGHAARPNSASSSGTSWTPPPCNAPGGTTAVMHFAAFLDVGESVREPTKMLRTTWSVAERARGDDGRIGARFRVLSTCATYGEPIETPIAETHPQRPINSYGESKLAVERAAAFRRRVRPALRCAAGFNASVPIPRARSAKITRRRSIIPRAIEYYRRSWLAGVR